MTINSKDEIAALIDHTLLKPEAQHADIVRLCAEAEEACFASVCINPYWVPVAAAQLQGSTVKVCTVIGFPLGAGRTSARVAEAKIALADGARELDAVLNLGALRSGEQAAVEKDLAELVAAAHAGDSILKVILETCLLTDEEKRRACQIAKAAGADFVKTSTGFSTGGATQADVTLMRESVGPNIGVKASGGIRSLTALRDMVAAGANRIGTSSGVAILGELASGGAPVEVGNASAY